MIPFQYALDGPGLILVPAEVEGRHGTLLLDTGAPLIALNSKYMQANSLRGLDTNTTGDSQSGQEEQFPVNVHTLRLGTFLYHFDSTHIESPLQKLKTNALLLYQPRFDGLRDSSKRPVMGLLGLPAWAPFETIIDYVHKKIILIRVDSVGHRLAPVPQFVPAWTATLFPMVDPNVGPQPEHIGVEGRSPTCGFGGIFMLDTGTGGNGLTEKARKDLGKCIAASDSDETWRVDHLVVGGHSFDNVLITDDDPVDNLLGYRFLSSYGVVGLNLRAHQLIFYQGQSHP